MNLRCRLGLHQLVDCPDPNTESGGLEKQGYRACTRCTKEKDSGSYRTVAIVFRLPSGR